MLRECRHIKDDGLRCHAAAMNGKPYCFFHMKIQRLYKMPAPEISPLEDPTSVLLAIGQVVRGLNDETIDCRRAGLMLYGLQIAASVTARRKEVDPADSVRSIHNLAGESVEFSDAFFTGAPMLAPENSVCEPPHDCETCPHAESCEKRKTALPSTPDEQNNEPANGSEEAGRQVRDELYSYVLQQQELHPESFDHKLPSREEFHHLALEAAAEGSSPDSKAGCPTCPADSSRRTVPPKPWRRRTRRAVALAKADPSRRSLWRRRIPLLETWETKKPPKRYLPQLETRNAKRPGAHVSRRITQNQEQSRINLAQSPQSPLTRAPEPLVLRFGPFPEARHESPVDMRRGIPNGNRKVAFHSEKSRAAHG